MLQKIQRKLYVPSMMAFQLFVWYILPIRREYLSSAVNVFKDSPKTSDITKRDIFQLNCSQREETI